MKTVAFINQKGGVGKTTCALNIGAGLARLQKKVLLIDSDPQAGLTCSLGIYIDNNTKTIYELLKQEALLEEALISIDFGQLPRTQPKKGELYIIPSDIRLSAFEAECVTMADRELIFKRLIKHLHQFDYVLVDCPPSLGLLTVNVLAAVAEIFIPVQTEFLALQGLSQLFDVFKAVTQGLNPGLKIGGIIGTRYNRRKINKDIVKYLRDNFDHMVFDTVIRESVALSEAPSFGKDVYQHNLESLGAQDYLSLCKEIIAKERVV
jgi:chromosome partitioning protein